MVELIFLMVVAILVMVVMIWREIRQFRMNVENLESAIDDLDVELMLCVEKNSGEILEEVKVLQIDTNCNMDKLGGTRGS